MEVIWGHILKRPRATLSLITPHCILLYFLDIFSLIFASLYNIQCWFTSYLICVRHVPGLSERASESVWPWFGFTLAWNIILLSVFSSFSLFLFLSLIAFATTIAIQYRLGAISYRWDKNIFRTLIVQCLFWMSYFRT